MEIAWIQAIAYQPPVILGQQLNPFSPFHALVLESLKSPYISGGTATPNELVLAVYVCSLSWADRKKITTIDESKLKNWGKKQSKAAWRYELSNFKTYISESWMLPDTWKKPNSGTVKANGAYHLAVFAMRKLGMNEADAWNTPLSRLVCYRHVIEEQETGKSDIITDDEKTAMQKLKEPNNGAR